MNSKDLRNAVKSALYSADPAVAARWRLPNIKGNPVRPYAILTFVRADRRLSGTISGTLAGGNEVQNERGQFCVTAVVDPGVGEDGALDIVDAAESLLASGTRLSFTGGRLTILSADIQVGYPGKNEEDYRLPVFFEYSASALS